MKRIYLVLILLGLFVIIKCDNKCTNHRAKNDDNDDDNQTGEQSCKKNDNKWNNDRDKNPNHKDDDQRANKNNRNDKQKGNDKQPVTMVTCKQNCTKNEPYLVTEFESFEKQPGIIDVYVLVNCKASEDYLLQVTGEVISEIQEFDGSYQGARHINSSQAQCHYQLRRIAAVDTMAVTCEAVCFPGGQFVTDCVGNDDDKDDKDKEKDKNKDNDNNNDNDDDDDNRDRNENKDDKKKVTVTFKTSPYVVKVEKSTTIVIRDREEVTANCKPGDLLTGVIGLVESIEFSEATEGTVYQGATISPSNDSATCMFDKITSQVEDVKLHCNVICLPTGQFFRSSDEVTQVKERHSPYRVRRSERDITIEGKNAYIDIECNDTIHEYITGITGDTNAESGEYKGALYDNDNGGKGTCHFYGHLTTTNESFQYTCQATCIPKGYKDAILESNAKNWIHLIVLLLICSLI